METSVYPIREGRMALSVGHPRGTHSRYVIGCCLIPLGICGLKNNSKRTTYGIWCVWEMPSLSPLSSLGVIISLIKLPLHRIYTEIILPFFSSIFRLICCGL